MGLKMAKAQPKKKSSLIKWLLIGGGLVVGYLVLTPPDDSRAAATAKPGVKKTSPTDQLYVKADYDHETNPYPPLKLASVDAFKPDIVHGTGMDPADPVGVGWTYSGMATVDGVGQGIMVNTNSGESAILHRGEKWQAYKVADITADHMVFNGPNGPETVHVDTKDSDKPSPNATTAAVGQLPAFTAPMQMPLTGDIGSGDQSLSIVQDNSGFGGGRGRRGRGRGRNAGN
jgi:hypothetical protein